VRVCVCVCVCHYVDVCLVQVLVMLVGDPSYKFIHVEDFGYVVSYEPRTSFGDYQTMLPVSDHLL